MVCAMAATAAPNAAPDLMAPATILQELREFSETGSILYVAAHPDDENSRLIAYLARGLAIRTAYLSLTRGDGGQNLIGPELGDELGVIRTQELLGARGIDGARQYFSRAKDFGFSKDFKQALSVWDHQAVLADVVRTIRTFRPDVMITRFPPWPSGTHGQHTASAVLALEAFKLAGDPKAFPEQLGEGKLAPWQPKRIFWNNTPRGGDGATPAGSLRLAVDGFDPLTGEWFGVFGARSRSMQRTQGMGSVGTRGDWSESFRLLAGEPAAREIWDGIDRTWSRFAGGAELGRQAAEITAHFDPQHPAASVPALLELRRQLVEKLIRPLPTSDPVLYDKQQLLDRILQGCLGLHLESVVADGELVPGETLRLHRRVVLNADIPVRWWLWAPPVSARREDPVSLRPHQEVTRDWVQRLPADEPVSVPFWLQEEGTKAMFHLSDSPLAIHAAALPAFATDETFEVGGQELTFRDEAVQVIGDPARGELRRPLAIIPPAWVSFAQEVALFAPGGTRTVAVEVTAARKGTAGVLRIEAPEGWQVAPAERAFRLELAGQKQSFAFTVSAPARAATAQLGVSVEVGGRRYYNRRIDFRYDHIPNPLYQPVARLKAVSLELAIRGRRVGYLPGAGDHVAESLALMGYAVQPLTAADLTPEGLKGLDAVVLGVRAFNVLADLPPRLPALWSYVESGGNVIVQYNTDFRLKTAAIAPYPLTLSDGRVTDETAPVTLLAPDHPALTTPNRIGPADFEGWVQERARYLPSVWDAHFVPLLAAGDPGEAPNGASLLVARYGRGYFVYSGLAWFRELPAGVPGAYRLFANLVSLGK